MKALGRAVERLDSARWLPYTVWIVCAAYALAYLYRGWIPWDVGTLGQAAERVLAGELPHRDFTEVYTGGLAFLNALAFAVAGIGIAPMRWVIFGAYLFWIPAVWYLARLYAPPSMAATATLLAASLTLPMYSEGMPNWYNLFFATWGMVALVRHLETGKKSWLFLAGLAGGLSITIKVIGLYFLSAAFLLLIYAENGARAGLTEAAGNRTESDAPSDAAFRGVIALMLGALVTVVLLLAGRSGGPHGILYYATPTLAVVAVLLDRLRLPSADPSRTRYLELGAMTAILLGGAALPVVLFMVPFALGGALGDLLHGVFVLPFTRFETVTAPFPAPRGILAAGAVVWLVARAPTGEASGGRIAAASLLGTVAALVMLDGNVRFYAEVIMHLGALVSVLVVAAAWTLAKDSDEPTQSLRFVVLAATALLTLVHLPTPASPYVFFVAPVAVLLSLSIGATGARSLRRIHVGIGLTLAVMVLYMNPLFIRPPAQTVPFEMERARGIRVAPAEKAQYETIAELLRQHGSSEYTLAIPDSPEIYFLTGLRNPLGSLYDLFEDAEGRTERVLRALDEHEIDAVVVNHLPSYSEPVAADLMEALQARYPQAVAVGRFTVAWSN